VPKQAQFEDESVTRLLHAKGLSLTRENAALYLVGSSNFTRKGLGLVGGHNFELNAAYLLRDVSTPLGKMLDASWPRSVEIEDRSAARFLGGLQQSEDETANAALLPAGFGLVLYRGPSKEARLELEITDDVPAEFVVCAPTSETLLDAPTWRAQGAKAITVIPWKQQKPPSALSVRWNATNGEACEAKWIVNVFDASSLPASADLESLTLEELIEVLTSARPLHEMLNRALERRERSNEDKLPAVEVDPHRKVDTSTFLLRRMKRLSHALEGMRERFQQPIAFLETLRFKLRGPVGPIELARRLVAEEKGGAAFMIAELATSLESIQWRPIGTLDQKQVRSEVRAVIAELRAMAEATEPVGSMADYVRTAFEELAS
jgi:hypothetical protein